MIMTRNRFLAVDKFFHFVNNSVLDSDDHLRKIRPVVNCDCVHTRFIFVDMVMAPLVRNTCHCCLIVVTVVC